MVCYGTICMHFSGLMIYKQFCQDLTESSEFKRNPPKLRDEVIMYHCITIQPVIVSKLKLKGTQQFDGFVFI